jgi:hypothetical protein
MNCENQPTESSPRVRVPLRRALTRGDYRRARLFIVCERGGERDLRRVRGGRYMSGAPGRPRGLTSKVSSRPE